jgi:putative ABC transport system permease protein
LALIGWTLGLTLSRYIRTLLYSLAPNDPVTMIEAVLLLAALVVGASLVPALRAVRVDPVMAFRND